MNSHANIPRRYSTDDLPQPSVAIRSAAAAIWNPINSFLEWFGGTRHVYLASAPLHHQTPL